MHDTSAARRPWLRRLSRGSIPPEIRLFSFPFAGGGASSFRGWAQDLPAAVDLFAVQPPGREDRLYEPTISEMTIAVAVITDEILQYADQPFALEDQRHLPRELRDVHGVEPAKIFVSGCRALPALHEGRRDLHDLPDEDLVIELRRMNGTPEAILQNPDFMRLLLPAIRADYSMLSKYVFEPGRVPSHALTVFGGDNDPAVETRYLEQWADLVDGDLDMVVLPGDHFFLHSARAVLLRELSARLVARPYAARELRVSSQPG